MRVVQICTFLFAVLPQLTIATEVAAQCDPQWLPGDGVPGVDRFSTSSVSSVQINCLTVWDPDGAGPRQSVLVAGGSFDLAGRAQAHAIAMWDPLTEVWHPLGAGLGESTTSVIAGTVYSISVLPNGNLVAVGSFRRAGAVAASCVAEWNGTEWSALGNNGHGTITASFVSDAGELFIGGRLLMPGTSSSYRYVAKWTGTEWQQFGKPLSGTIKAIAQTAEGSIVVAGNVWLPGTSGDNSNIFSWTGADWSPLGGGASASVEAIKRARDGRLYAAGNFKRIGTTNASCMAIWDGQSWSAVETGITTTIYAIEQTAEDHWIATGPFAKVGGVDAAGIGRWDGHAWHAIGKGIGSTDWSSNTGLALARMPNGEMCVGGAFSFALHNAARWTGSRWMALGRGLDLPPATTLRLSNNRGLVAGGSMTSAAGRELNFITIWNGSDWLPLDSGMNGLVLALAEDSHGSIIAVGDFTTAGGTPARRVARWDGVRWAAMGAGLGDHPNSRVRAILASRSGEIYAAGSFLSSAGSLGPAIARWDANAWSAFGPELVGSASDLLFDSDGNLLAVGRFSLPGQADAITVAQWNGSQWVRHSPSLSYGSIGQAISLPGGNLVLAGSSQSLGSFLCQWTGSQWVDVCQVGLSSGGSNQAPLYAVARAENGHLYLAGNFLQAWQPNITWLNHACRVVDGKYQPLGAGMNAGLSGYANSVIELAPNELAYTGNFSLANGQPLHAFARWSENPKPSVGSGPRPSAAITGESLTLSAIAAMGYSSTSFQWQREAPSDSGQFVDVYNGPSGATPSNTGGTVSGASGQLPSPTDGTPATLTISNIQPSDAGMYRVTFWNTCGEVSSIPVEVKVKAHITDINADGQVDDADFVLFVTQYNAMLCAAPDMVDACSADFNQDGSVDDADFAIFVPGYDAMVLP